MLFPCPHIILIMIETFVEIRQIMLSGGSTLFNRGSISVRVTSFGLLLMHKLAYGKRWVETVVWRST
jgi:hypothetical protein